MDRREFLAACGLSATGLLFGTGLGCRRRPATPGDPQWESPQSAREDLFRDARVQPHLAGRPALFQQPLADGRVRCTLCPKDCVVAPGEAAFCKVRVNQGGELQTLTYGYVAELYHRPLPPLASMALYKGANLFVGTFGCSFDCDFCISLPESLAFPDPREVRLLPMSPTGIVDKAVAMGSTGVHLGTFEPSVNIEFTLDIAREAKRRNLRVLLDTNGFVHPEPMDRLLETVDCVWLGFKGMDPGFYRDTCRGTPDPVLATLRRIKDSGVYLGICYLLAPPFNGEIEEVDRTLDVLLAAAGPDTMLFLLGLMPVRRMRNLPPTPVPFLDDALARARSKGFRYPLIVDAARKDIRPAELTCPGCGQVIVSCPPDRPCVTRVTGGLCDACGAPIRLLV